MSFLSGSNLAWAVAQDAQMAVDKERRQGSVVVGVAPLGNKGSYWGYRGHSFGNGSRIEQEHAAAREAAGERLFATD